MKRVAFVFTHGPHGGAGGREGLDALLATSALSEDLGVFLSAMAYCSCCRASNRKRFWRAITLPPSACCRCMTWSAAICASFAAGAWAEPVTDWVLDAEVLAPDELRRELAGYDAVMTF